MHVRKFKSETYVTHFLAEIYRYHIFMCNFSQYQYAVPYIGVMVSHDFSPQNLFINLFQEKNRNWRNKFRFFADLQDPVFDWIQFRIVGGIQGDIIRDHFLFFINAIFQFIFQKELFIDRLGQATYFTSKGNGSKETNLHSIGRRYR